MKKHDLISATFWFFVGLFITLYAPQFDLGTLSMPGAGLMPFVAGIVMCTFAAIAAIQAWASPSGEVEHLWHDVAYFKIGTVLLMLIVYALFFEWIGFIICTFVLMFVLMNFVGSIKWTSSLAGALLSAILAYLIFEVWLQAQLPRGILINLGI